MLSQLKIGNERTEVASLMKLFRGYLQNKFVELVEKNVKVNFIGDTNPIADDIVKQMKCLEKATNLTMA